MVISKKIKGCFWGDVDVNFYKDNISSLNNTNYKLLKTACLFSSCMCGFLFVLTLISPIIAHLSKFYFFYTLFFSIETALVFNVVKKHLSLSSLFFYIFAAAIFLLAADVGTLKTPDLPAVTFFVFLIIIPTLRVQRPIYSILLSISACVGFCILTATVKKDFPLLVSTDTLNAICCCIVGIGLNVTTINLQLGHIRSKSELRHQSVTDELTGLPNRRCFNFYIDEMFRMSSKKNTDLSILMMDIDNFKIYNDTYGHLMGDDCLQIVSRRLNETAERHKIFLARYGGEEFVAVDPSGNVTDLQAVSNTFVEDVFALNIENKNAVPYGKITISIGCAGLYETASKSYMELLDSADNALYLAKKQGKNTSVVCKPLP